MAQAAGVGAPAIEMFPVPDVPAPVAAVIVAVVPGTRCDMPVVPPGAGRTKTIFVSLPSAHQLRTLHAHSPVRSSHLCT